MLKLYASIFVHLISELSGSFMAGFGKGALIGFGIAVFLLFLAHGLGLFKRQSRLLSLLTVLYYPYLLLLFTGVFGAWFGVAEVHGRLVLLCDKARPVVTEASVEVTEFVLSEFYGLAPEASISLKNELLPAIRAKLIERFFPGLAASSDLPAPVRMLIGKAADLISDRIVAEIQQRILQNFVGKLADTLNIDARDLRAFWNKDIVQAMRDGMVMKIVEKQIREYFASVGSGISFSGILLFLPVLLETLFALYTRKHAAAELK